MEGWKPGPEITRFLRFQEMSSPSDIDSSVCIGAINPFASNIPNSGFLTHKVYEVMVISDYVHLNKMTTFFPGGREAAAFPNVFDYTRGRRGMDLDRKKNGVRFTSERFPRCSEGSSRHSWIARCWRKFWYCWSFRL